MMEEDLPQLQIKRLKEEEREQLKRSPPSTEFNGHRVPSSPSAAGGNLSPAITNQQRPQSSALAMGTGATPTAWKSPANGSGGGGGERPGTSNLIGGGRGSLTSDFRAQTPLYGLGVKSGSLERESNPIEFSSSPILAASPLETMNVPPKPVVPKTTAFGGVALKPESKPARTIMPSAAGGKGQGKGTSLAEAAARQLKEEMRAEAEAAPTIRLNPNLKSKTPPTSSSNVVQESPVSVHRAPLVVAADDDDDDEDEGGEWGASRTDYSAAELSTEQEIEHIAPSEFRPQRVSGAGQGNSIMSTRNSNGTSAVSPSTDKTPAASAPQQPLFAKRTAASDDGGAARKAQLPTLDSKGAKKGLAKASTGSRASNEANTTLLSKAASSRTTKTVYASPPLSKAPTATRTSNNANASLLTKAGSSRMSNSGGAPPSLTKAPTATRASNSDGFVPMKIDWNKASDSSLSASAFGAGDAKASTSTLSRSGSKRFSSNGVAAPASNSSLLPKASTMERTSPSLLTKTGSTRVSSSGGAPPPSLTKAPTATRGSNNNGFTPMKIDWNKASDSAGK